MQLELTRSFAAKSRRPADLGELDDLEARMGRAGYNASDGRQGPVCDTIYMIWPVVDELSIRMSRLWFAEVALHSAYEKASFGAPPIAPLTPHHPSQSSHSTCRTALRRLGCLPGSGVQGRVLFSRVRIFAPATLQM